ncbi:hypothetical protein [Actinoplanes sp. NPDC049265]|uniref:hypothetical protein n=1 Tax=Actinoplanes sp. NPDC049265 TaxID=3363902 RepID=UPI00371B6B44
MQEDELRRYVSRKLRRPQLFPGVWGLLMHEGYVEDVLYGAEDRDWLVERAREMLDFGPAEKPAESADQRGPSVGQERAWALSQLVAHHAAGDPDVVAFRAKHLPDGLIPWADVESWIETRSALEGERTNDVKFTIPKGTHIERERASTRFNPPIAEVTTGIQYSSRTIAYAIPGDTAVRRRFANTNGVLDRLSRLGESLADAFGWQPVQGTVFVLTGVTPLIATVRLTTPGIKIRHNYSVDWARRITLDIDPAATSDEVLAAFEQARNEFGQASRRRRMTPKHLRLAAFTGAEHADKPWAERHRLWNEKFSDWAYPNQSNFRRDAAQAQRRLLNPWSE